MSKPYHIWTHIVELINNFNTNWRIQMGDHKKEWISWSYHLLQLVYGFCIILNYLYWFPCHMHGWQSIIHYLAVFLTELYISVCKKPEFVFYDSPTWSGDHQLKSACAHPSIVSRNLVECYTWPGRGNISVLAIDHLLFPAESLNFPVVGIIDGKFDTGYFVTVTLGSKILQGVLYPVPPLGFASMSSTNPDNAVDPFSAPCLRCRWKRGKRRRNPAHPKTNRSAYNFFFAEKHSKLKLHYPQREREFSKMIEESWNKLTQEERTVGNCRDFKFPTKVFF